MNGGISGQTYLPLAYAENTFFFGWISPLTWRNSDILEIVVMGFLCSTIVKSRMGVQSWNITYLMLLRKPQIICHMGISGRTRAENR